MKISILTIGSELLDGRVADTNTLFIANSVGEYGIQINNRLSVVDSIEDIKQALDYLYKDSSIVILTGGLGPTSDDLTREAVASYFGVALTLNPDLLTEIKAYFERRKRVFDPANTKQAEVPAGAIIIKNPNGSAPGFIISKDNRTAISLPGVPRELQTMFADTVVPFLKEQHSSLFAPQHLLHFKLFGMPEAVVGRKIDALNLPSDITVSYRAKFPEIHVTLKSASKIEELSEKIKFALGSDFVFSTTKDSSLQKVVHDLLLETNNTIAVAESCTAGLVGKLLTEFDGSSRYFLGGIIAYANEVKTKFLGVSEETLNNYGAVSHQCVRQMADGVRERFHSSIGVSVSGIAGSTSDSSGKPVGTFFLGLSRAEGTTSYRFLFPSTRDLIRGYAGFKALEAVRRGLLGLPSPDDAEFSLGPVI